MNREPTGSALQAMGASGATTSAYDAHEPLHESDTQAVEEQPNSAAVDGLERVIDRGGLAPEHVDPIRSVEAAAADDAGSAPFAGSAGQRSPEVVAASRRRRDGTNVIVGLALTIFLIAGIFDVVTGGISTNNSPTRFSDPVAATAQASSTTPASGAQTAQPSSPIDPPSPAASPGALVEAGPASPCVADPLRFTAGWLLAALHQAGFPVHALPGAPAQVSTSLAEPPSAKLCTQVSFSDSRGTGTNRLAVYETPAAASEAASLATGRAVMVGRAVLELDPSIALVRARYTTMIGDLLRPAASAPSTTTSGAPLATPSSTEAATRGTP